MTARLRLSGWVPSRIALGALVVATLAAAAGGAGGAGAAIAIPSELPNRTYQGEFQFRWALVRETGTVRAVGWADASNRIVAWVRVALLGVDQNGRVVSRGDREVPGGFGRTSLPFEVSLRPTGREERFELVLVQAHEGKPGE
jgi:hypothetical protein